MCDTRCLCLAYKHKTRTTQNLCNIEQSISLNLAWANNIYIYNVFTIVYDDHKDANDKDDDDVDEGVTKADPSGEFRQRGHVPFNFSHSSMQLAWK
jgi:hypothetical protein